MSMEALEKVKHEIAKAEDRIRYYEQQDKIMRSEIRRLTRKERTHRLCTRGGLVEHFILEPDLLTDADVYIVYTEIILPPNAPPEYSDRNTLWNAAEKIEKQWNDRRDERSEWSVSGQRKGTNMDLKKVSHAIAFLQEHEIATTEDLQKHLDKKEAAFSDLDNTIRGKEKRLRDVQALVKASDSAERLLPIQHQYAAIGWKSKKEKFYQEHKVEIDEYNKALRLLYKFYPDRKIPNRTLKAELKELSDDLEALNKELAAIKADLDELRFVRNCITPREDINEEENLTIEAKQAPKEKASLIDRLHDKQQIADEQKQKGKSHSHGYEKDYER